VRDVTTAPVLSVRRVDGDPRTYYRVWCPACDDLHQVTDDWGWDGNREAPSFNPSILVTGGSRGIVCHSFLTEGVWSYLTDSTHALAGLTAPMAALPDWLVAEGTE
jgi:hypothetical protein